MPALSFNCPPATSKRESSTVKPWLSPISASVTLSVPTTAPGWFSGMLEAESEISVGASLAPSIEIVNVALSVPPLPSDTV
jgi:hypothetical protein